jgi:hypothetical protein
MIHTVDDVVLLVVCAASQAGCATLREAAELSGAFKRVEEVFAAGDLPRVADMLRSMARRCVMLLLLFTTALYLQLLYPAATGACFCSRRPAQAGRHAEQDGTQVQK